MDGDNLITLDEALAFISYCDDGDFLDESARVQDFHEPFSLEDIDELLDAAIKAPITISSSRTPRRKHHLVATKLEAASPTRKTKRVRSAASSSTLLQRRKKAEIETLREQAVELEGYLAQLYKNGGQRNVLAAF